MFIHCFGPTPKSNSQITSSACSFIVLDPPPSQVFRSQVPRVHSLFLGPPPSQILRSQVPRVHSWAHPQVKFSDHKFRVFIHCLGPTPKSKIQITSSTCSLAVLGPPPSQIIRSQVPRVHSLYWAQPQVKFSDHKFRVFIHCFGPTPKSNSQIASSVCSFIVLGQPQVKFSDHKFRVFIHCFGPTPKSNSQITSSTCSFIVLGPPPSQILRSQVPRVHSLLSAHPQVKFSGHEFRVFIHWFVPTPRSNSQITSFACSFIVLGPPPSQILRSQVPRVH